MKDIIELPVEITTKGLTLEQIGAITVLMTIPHIDIEFHVPYKELNKIVENLSDIGIIKMENGEVVIDLSDKEPESYFRIDDYDDNDNPIYYAMSYFCSDDDFCGSPYYWRVKPILWDMKILWKNCSDADIRRPNDEEVFDSLEDAEAYFREEDEKSLNYGSK
jgi:hypothetical protein